MSQEPLWVPRKGASACRRSACLGAEPESCTVFLGLEFISFLQNHSPPAPEKSVFPKDYEQSQHLSIHPCIHPTYLLSSAYGTGAVQ